MCKNPIPDAWGNIRCPPKPQFTLNLSSSNNVTQKSTATSRASALKRGGSSR